MPLRATINTYVPWNTLASILDIPCQSKALPLKTDCPLCGGARLNVYQDSISGGQWHYCFDCQTSGDMIELAAKVWDISPQAAVSKLVAAGVPIPQERSSHEYIATYMTNYPQRRRRMQDFWRRSMEFLAQTHSKPLSYLRDKFSLKGQISPDRWAKGPGQLMGGVNVRDAELLYRSTGNEGSNRPFAGRGWSDLLVFPYYIAPDRMAGFLFVGREGTTQDRVYKSTHRTDRGVEHVRTEAGLFGMPTVRQANRMFGQYCFAVDDTLLAMRMQIRHYASSDLPLPLVSWHDQGRLLTKDAWYGLERQQVIFWGFKPTASMIHQARLCDGYLAIVPLYENKKKSVDHYIRLASPADLFRRAVRRAVPWKEALVTWAKQQGVGPVEELLIGLERYGISATTLMSEIGYNFDGVLSAPKLRSLQLGTMKIIERDDGWYYTNATVKSESLLSDAKLYIEEIIGGDKPMYRGMIHYLGTDIPFCCPFRELENDAKQFIIDACVNAGVGRPRVLQHSKFGMMEIAIGFNKPRTIVPCEDKDQ